MFFINESIKKYKKIKYIGIDISEKGNQMLIENLKRFNEGNN